LESQLDETRKELRLSQLIMKLLYKEINDITTETKPGPTITIHKWEAGGGIASSNTWSSVAARRPYNKNKARISDTK